MQNIETFAEALNLYLTNNILVMIFLVAAVYILIKSEKNTKRYIVAVAISAALFVFNGIVFLVADKLGENTTYYRFFWMCPVVLLSAYLLIELFFSDKIEKRKKGLLSLICIAYFLLNYSQSILNWKNIPANVYRLDNDIIQIADMIDEHSGGRRVRFLDNGLISAHIREYNANMIISNDGTVFLNEILYTDDTDYLGKEVMEFMNMNGSEYIAVEQDKYGTNRVFENAGFSRIGKSDNYNLYHVDYEVMLAYFTELEAVLQEKQIYLNSETLFLEGLEKEYQYLYVTDLWDGVTAEQRNDVIEIANDFQVDGVIINGSTDSTVTEAQIEEDLQELQVPYWYHGGDLQIVKEENFSIIMVNEEADSEDLIQLKADMSETKHTILVTQEALQSDKTDEALWKQITDADNAVIEVLTDGDESHLKEMLNDNIMQYSAQNVEEGFMTLIRMKGLETQ